MFYCCFIGPDPPPRCSYRAVSTKLDLMAIVTGMRRGFRPASRFPQSPMPGGWLKLVPIEIRRIDMALRRYWVSVPIADIGRSSVHSRNFRRRGPERPYARF